MSDIKVRKTQKFKAGDKVRIVNDDHHPNHFLVIGSEAVVCGDAASPYGWDVRGVSRSTGLFISQTVNALCMKRLCCPAGLTYQAKIILNHLLTGKEITRLSAMYLFGVQNLTARITELRHAGIPIQVEKKRDANDVLYGSYSLEAADVELLKRDRTNLFGIKR